MVKKLSVYLVGGAVRDELLGRPVVDRDWVVIGARPEDLLALGYRQIGAEFPCFLHPDTKDEYALARTERKSGRGHTGFVCDFGPQVTLEEDLRRRDLTINAIARTADGRYIDPYGGRADLEARVLRHVSDAFAEDPLRVLRVARFAARYAELGFRVHDDTLMLMSSLVSAGEMSELTPERVWKEISSALTEPQPSVFFRVLLACGALGILLPEIDTGDQVMTAVDTARRKFDTPVVTWAALMRDLGDVALVKAVGDRLKVPRDFKDLAALVCEHHARCRRLPELRPEAVLQLLEAVDGMRRPERLRHFAQACDAERLTAFGGVARAVEIQPLLDQGLEGLELAEQIRRLRVVALAEGC